MSVISSLPKFAQGPVNRLRQGELPQGVERQALTEEGQQEAGKSVFAAAMLAQMDEVEGKDQAMGQPGKVVQGPMTCEFEIKGEQQMEAVIYGKTPTNEDAALYVSADEKGLQSFALLDHGDTIEIRGAVMTPAGEDKFDGYLVAGQTPDA